jgi:putative DNA primase/helicase
MFCIEFADAIRAHGMETPCEMKAGKFYRMPGVGKKLNNRAGWCVLFEDGKGGCFGDWSTGLSEAWRAKRIIKLSKNQRAEFAQRGREIRCNAYEDREAKYEEAAVKATSIYACSAQPPSDFPYLVEKRIKPHNSRLCGHRLVLPIMDFSQNITSLQYIAGNGVKRMLPGGRKKGCFIPLNEQFAGVSWVIICEGWATGVTLAEEYSEALVIAAVDSGNLTSVAIGVSLKWPELKIVIAGDDDRSKLKNIGKEKAEETARLVGAEMMLPQFPEDAPLYLSDFNDLAVYLTGRHS